MNVVITPVSEAKFEAAIEIPHEELQPRFDVAYERYRPKAQVHGFRKGKVPLDLVRRLYAEAIEEEELQTIADDAYREAMSERKIRPFGQPALVGMDFKRKQHLRFRITYEVKPEIVLKGYRGLAVERLLHEVTDEDVEAEIEHLRRANSTTVDAEMATDPDHIVTASVQELDQAGTPLVGRKREAVPFYLADTTLAREIKDGLLNARAGDTVTVVLPPGPQEQREESRLSFTVSKIQKVNLPPVDADLVKKVTGGKVENPEDFRAALRSDLQRYAEERSTAQLRDALAAEVVRLHEFPIPESLVSSFLDAFVEDVRRRSRGNVLPKGFDEQAFRNEQRAGAVWQAKWMLLKERIAAEENLTVTDEDLARLADADAARLGIDRDRMLAYHRQSSSTTDHILGDKVLALLAQHATITPRKAGPAAGAR